MVEVMNSEVILAFPSSKYSRKATSKNPRDYYCVDASMIFTIKQSWQVRHLKDKTKILRSESPRLCFIQEPISITRNPAQGTRFLDSAGREQPYTDRG